MVRVGIDWLSRTFSFLSSDCLRSFVDIYFESLSSYTGRHWIDDPEIYNSLLLLLRDQRQHQNPTKPNERTTRNRQKTLNNPSLNSATINPCDGLIALH
ncbi:hypothetical protein TMatcc_000947 [Talaromyces marneffei ATCC 18224]